MSTIEGSPVSSPPSKRVKLTSNSLQNGQNGEKHISVSIYWVVDYLDYYLEVICEYMVDILAPEIVIAQVWASSLAGRYFFLWFHFKLVLGTISSHT